MNDQDLSQSMGIRPPQNSENMKKNAKKLLN